MKIPHIFIFTLKNTIIGNINCTEHLFYIIKEFNKNNYTYNEDKDTIIEELEKGLLRPYFKDFIEIIKTKYKYYELYIHLKNYDNYLYFIIKNIEKICSVKFHIKDFSIIDNQIYKDGSLSLINIFDIIIDDLQSKYPLLSKHKKIIFDKQLYYIDANYNNLNDYPNKQILCSSYNYEEEYDIQFKLINVYGIKDNFFDNKEVLDYFNNHNLPIYNKNSKNPLNRDKLYQSIFKLIKIKEADINNNDIDDNYFKLLFFLNDNNNNIKKI